MRYIATLALIALSFGADAKAQSKLLESVKRNPKEAKAICERFRVLNQTGISALSEQSIAEIATKKNLSETDAEILSTYVLGLNCPDVR